MKTINDNNDSLHSLMGYCLDLNQGLCAFRGQSDSRYRLVPGIYRGLDELDPSFKPEDDYEWVCRMERDTYRNFIDKGRNLNSNQASRDQWEHLIDGQHHGLPTRLLDWTEDHFAAIYFAVSANSDKDGALWHLDIKAFPHPEILGRLSDNSAFRIEAVRSCINPNDLVFFVPQSRTAISGSLVRWPGPSAFPSNQSRDSNRSGFLTFLLAPYTDDRIRNQRGIFSIYLTNDQTDIVLDHASYIQHLEEAYGVELLTKIIIPAAKKESIKRDLVKTGRDAFSIYPDLEGLITMLKDERASKFAYYKNERKNWGK